MMFVVKTKETRMRLSLLNLFSVLSIFLLAAVDQASAQAQQRDNRPRTASISGRVTIAGKGAANVKVVVTEIKERSALGSQDFSIAASGSDAGEDHVVLTDAEGRYR